MTFSRVFLCLCLSFIGGVFLNSFITTSQTHVLGFLILGIIFISVFWRYKKPMVLGCCLLLFGAGMWRYQVIELRIMNNELRKHAELKENITLFGFVYSQPIMGEKTTKLKIQPEGFGGKVLVTCWKYPEHEYGDRLKITGTLEEPPLFEDFSYKDYLAKDGIFAVMYFPKIELVGKGFGNPVMKYLFSLKDTLKESLNKIMPLPQAGLMEGLLFGDEDSISKEWKDKFNLTGTRHITAVSGMNITIISTLVLNSLLFFGLWRNQAFYLSIILIFLYILMIGAPSSVIRAGMMGFLFLTAQHFGRISSGSRAIVFSAAFMLFLNPQLLKSDVGFQLSFLAIMGLVYLQPVFLDLLRKIPRNFELRYTLASTIAAQFFALPVLIYNFGQIPLIGPLANVFIVPLLAMITILGFIFSFLGIFSYALGQILSFPAWLLLTYIFKIIDLSSKIPYATLTFKNVSFVWILVSYTILGFVVWRLQEKQKLKFLNY